MASKIYDIEEVPLTRRAVNGGGEGHKEFIKHWCAATPHLESDFIGQVSSGYPSSDRGSPARAVESAMRIVGAAIQVPSNVGGVSEKAVTNRAGSTALMPIEKPVHRLRALGAVFDDFDNGVDK